MPHVYVEMILFLEKQRNNEQKNKIVEDACLTKSRGSIAHMFPSENLNLQEFSRILPYKIGAFSYLRLRKFWYCIHVLHR
jgi:hypothetical protein